MIKIYINPTHPELLYSVAAIMMKFRNNFHLLYTIAAYPCELEACHEEIKKNIFSLAEGIIDKGQEYTNSAFDGSKFSEAIYSDIRTEKIFILDLHPFAPGDAANIVNFVDKHKENIALFVDEPDFWEDKNALNYLQGEAINILMEPKKLCLNQMIKFGYEVPPEWIKESEDLAYGILENHRVARYAYALHAAQIKDANLGTNENYASIFELCAGELGFNVHHSEIDDLFDEYCDASDKILSFKKQIKKKLTNYPGNCNPERPIGYLHLPEFSSTLDINELLTYGKKIYPWLFIVAYTVGKKVIMHAESARLPIKDVIRKIREVSNDSHDLKTLLTLLEKEVSDFKKK